ncbi:MAG: hypothetical protein VXY42_00340 [Candidatus Thermoplasmatota archaeon]|nr:hypothetical protein [Candidatus Thermoplasmatota archaeon]MEC7253483.1 hypothetical protein [Candidatus Thermoplasmatota archaeon]MEC8608931.1 hypothetical protein [Candidatus Thermoplasmatota archaeon]
MAGNWSVVRCPACRNCHGTRGKPRQCPHCGQSIPATTPVIATAESSAQLRIEVALANTPEELRDELRLKLESSDEPLIASSSTSPRALYKAIQKTVGDDMILHRSDVEKVLQDLDSQQSPDDVLEKMELDGTLLRQQNGTWLLLE